MAQQDGRDGAAAGVYLSPTAANGAAFRDACGALFADLALADGIDACAALLERQRPDLLVIDLERFAPGVDGDALRALAAGAARTLLLCPGAAAAWLPLLVRDDGVAYAITPLDPARLRVRIEGALAGDPASPAPAADAVRRLLRLRGLAQRALDGAADVPAFAQRLCDVLCDAGTGWPGLLHAAFLQRAPDGDLRLAVQAGTPGLHLAALLGGSDGLQHAPLRHAFPGLLAATSGALVLMDGPEQGGDAALAQALRGHGVAQALGVAVPADGPGRARGALSLLFAAADPFTADELALLDDLAHLAAAGMRLLETVAENDTLLARLHHATTVDALTGVPNRRHGEDVLEQEIRRARRYQLPLALVAFDIDRFRAVNDTYGHPVGDVALRTVADVVRAALRASDVLARSGGEEFHIVAPHTSAVDALRMAEKIRLAVEATPIPGCDHLTISLGVAQLGEQESGDSLAQRAHAALARAKRAGRNCVELAMQ